LHIGTITEMNNPILPLAPSRANGRKASNDDDVKAERAGAMGVSW